jgi:hypothetical protein
VGRGRGREGRRTKLKEIARTTLNAADPKLYCYYWTLHATKYRKHGRTHLWTGGEVYSPLLIRVCRIALYHFEEITH